MLTQKKFLNADDSPKNNRMLVSLQENSFKDTGDGVITFPNGLTITDGTEQHNGTKYDIKSMKIEDFKHKITVNHDDSVEKIVATAQGVKKGKDRVFLEGLKFAVKESALARFVYDMMKGGFVTDFSIETMGPWPDDEGVYYNSSLVGLSIVTVGNNKSATINKIVLNAIEEAKKDGLDTTLVESEYLHESEVNNNTQENQMKFRTIKNSRKFAVSLKYKNGAGEETQVEVQPGATVDVPDTEGDSVQSQVDSATEPQVEEPKEEKATSALDLGAAVKNAVAPLMEKITSLEQQVFDNSAEEPSFTKAKASNSTLSKNTASELKGLSYEDRHEIQINAILDLGKSHGSDLDAAKRLRSINQFHRDSLVEAKKISNSVTLGDFGNFVISPEMLTDIEGFRSDFSGLLGATSWRETLSLQMAWLKRSGDINMQSVEMCDDGANGNLKPISDYSATQETANLEELAAVTPVCNAATRFLAVDLLADVAQGYRTDYDRKRAQLVIARLQQAINETGNQVAYNKTTNLTAMQSWVALFTQMQEEIMNGTYIFNQQTYGELIGVAMAAGISGPLSGLFTSGDQKMILGRPYIVVPNELMPSLNTNQTKTFVVDGANVTIREGVFYAELPKFKGRISGGLKYDMSTEAAYEENGTVKSAYQRNELVMRGSFFRGGAFTDEDRVVGLVAAGIS